MNTLSNAKGLSQESSSYPMEETNPADEAVDKPYEADEGEVAAEGETGDD